RTGQPTARPQIRSRLTAGHVPGETRSLLEGVLDLLASQFQVALHLVSLAFAFHVRVVESLASALLDLAFGRLGLVLCLICSAHSCSFLSTYRRTCLSAAHENSFLTSGTARRGKTEPRDRASCTIVRMRRAHSLPPA